MGVLPTFKETLEGYMRFMRPDLDSPQVNHQAEGGVPYTVGEARLYLAKCGHKIDQYLRELMAFLVSEVERLEKFKHTVRFVDSKGRLHQFKSGEEPSPAEWASGGGSGLAEDAPRNYNCQYKPVAAGSPALVDHKTDACINWKDHPLAFYIYDLTVAEPERKELQVFASGLLVFQPEDEVQPDVVVKE